jgi:hypothetical protein
MTITKESFLLNYRVSENKKKQVLKARTNFFKLYLFNCHLNIWINKYNKLQDSKT